MKNVSYMTFAAVRNSAPEEFDRFIKEAVFEAGIAVGAAVVFEGLCHQTSVSAEQAKRAA